MKIRTQFIITMILFGMILVVIAGSAIIANRLARKASEQEKIAISIAQGANELSYLANDYLIYCESQQLSRWQSRFASFSNQVANLHVDKQEQQALARNIQANTQRLKEVFDSVISLLQRSSQARKVMPDSAFLQVSWSRTAVQSQGLVSDASRLSNLLHQQMDRLRGIRTALMYVMVCLFGLFLLASYMLTYRRILKSITTLQAGTAVIGSGNLNFNIEEKKNDEIGDLSRAFNRMTANLKDVTVSKSELEREIIERKKAESELRTSRKFLEIANKHSDLNPLLQEFVMEMKEFSNCEAVGIRLLDEQANIPYMAYLGFSQQFYETESPLSIDTDKCMCINVIKGTTNPRLPFYTDGGSFYMNGTTRFLATVSEEDKGQTRNVCNQVGYESVALIPIHVGTRMAGLIHLADHKENMVPLNMVKLLEQVASALGAGIQRAVAEEELRKQREWLGVTLSSIGDAVIATDAEGRITFMNPVAVSLTGWQTKEALGQSITSVFQIVNEKTRQPAGDLVARVLSEKRVVALANDTALVAKDGRDIPIEDSAAAILDAAGNIIGAVLVFHDVTARRRAQAELREAHERALWLARFPEQNPNPVIRASEDGTILYCNPSATKFAGWRCEVGRVLQNELLPLVGRAMGEGREVQQDLQLDGRVYIVWITPFPREGYANIYGRDITDRKQAEEALRQKTLELQRLTGTLEQEVRTRTVELEVTNETLKNEIDECQRVETELRKSERSLRQLSVELLNAQEKERKLVAGEIHDGIGSSLSAIKFKVETALAEALNGSPQTAAVLQSVVPIVQGAIDEARRIQMNLRPSMLDDLGVLATIKWFCRQFESTYSKIRVKQTVDIEEHEVPDSLKTVIFRVLQEGLNNVAKHSRTEVVFVSLWKKDGAIKLMIRDDGQGFDWSKLQPPDGTGRGMGLKNMRERAELSGGSLVIESTEGKGTTIHAAWLI